MRYHIYLVRELSNESPDFMAVATIDSEAPNPTLEAQLQARLLEGANQALVNSADTLPLGAPRSAQLGRRTGRKSRKVLIRGIEPEREAFVPFRLGEIVESGLELALLLGFTYNRVTQALSIAARKNREQASAEKDPAERRRIEEDIVEATLRGVTFCYVDELAKNED